MPSRPALGRGGDFSLGVGEGRGVAAAPAGEAGQFPALDVGDPQRVGVAELPGEVRGP